METADISQAERTEKRVASLTLILGAVASIAAVFLFSIRIGAGVLIGALLAWVNFRWLERAIDSVTRASTAQEGAPEAHVPILSYVGLFGRYFLIAGVVYVTFLGLRIPVLSILVGLCLLGVAVISASLFEVLGPAPRRND